MKKLKLFKIIPLIVIFMLVLSAAAYAGTWKQNNKGWWYENPDGTWPSNTWQWIDSNNDHIAYCYYFDKNGYCLLNQRTPDNYLVSASGEWIIETVGLPQTKLVNTPGIQADALPYMASAIYGGIKTPYFNPESDKINIDFRKKAPTSMEQAGIFDMLLDNNYAPEYFPAFFNKYKSADYAAELNKGVYTKIFKDVFGISNIDESWNISIIGINNIDASANSSLIKGNKNDAAKLNLSAKYYQAITPWFMVDSVTIEGGKYTVKGKLGELYINYGRFTTLPYTIVAEENPESDLGHIAVLSIKINEN